MRKSPLLVSGAALAALVLAGCGKAEQPATGGATSAANQPATTAAAFDSLQALSQAVDEGSSKAPSTHMVFTVDTAGEKITGEGDFVFSGADSSMAMTMDTPDGPVEFRFVDEAVYVKGPEEMEPGKPWLKLDLTSDNPLTAAFAGMVEQVKQTDPRQSVKELVDSGTIKETAPDTIDGKAVTKYVIEVDVVAAGKKKGMDQKTVEMLEKQGIKVVPFTVWIDGENLPVRAATEIPMQGQKTTMQMDYSDWGKAVTIDAPPADQVAELPNF